MRMNTTIFAFLTLLSFEAFAQSSAPLILKARVAQKLILTVTPVPMATTLPLDTTQNDLKVATASVVSNSASGFKVLVSSANMSNLKRLGGNQLFPYTMKYGNIQIPLNSPTATEFLSDGVINTSDNLTISYTGKPLDTMVAGEYQDTVTFTISAR